VIIQYNIGSKPVKCVNAMLFGSIQWCRFLISRGMDIY